jgi:pimeloyl-ACP methyl ester carboxylesterase
VIALDCRGHGQSGKPLESSQYGMEMVRDVIRLLDHLKIARAHIVGYSMGAGIAQQILVTYPNRALTVTLLGSGWEGEHLPALTSQLNAQADAFDRRDASALIRGVLTGGQGPSDAEVAAAQADLFSRNDPRVLAAIARSLPVLWRVSRRQLSSVTVPVLAIDGEYDRSNLDAARRMVGVVKGLELVELPGVNHATSVQPSAAHIVAFLGNHRSN